MDSPRPRNKLVEIAQQQQSGLMSNARIRTTIKGSDLNPLDLFLAVLRDASLPVGVRIEAAKNAAPYVHRRMPQEVETTNKMEVAFTSDELKGLSRQELLNLKGLLEKTGMKVADVRH